MTFMALRLYRYETDEVTQSKEQRQPAGEKAYLFQLPRPEGKWGPDAILQILALPPKE